MSEHKTNTKIKGFLLWVINSKRIKKENLKFSSVVRAAIKAYIDGDYDLECLTRQGTVGRKTVKIPVALIDEFTRKYLTAGISMFSEAVNSAIWEYLKRRNQ